MTEKKKKLCRFFVYGTLKEGGRFDGSHFAKLRSKVQKASLPGAIYNLGSFPTIKLDGKGMVMGEVHTFPKEHIDDIKRSFDRIEGYNPDAPTKGLYNRHIIEASLEDGEKVKAFVYEYNGSVDEDSKIESGVWEI